MQSADLFSRKGWRNCSQLFLLERTYLYHQHPRDISWTSYLKLFGWFKHCGQYAHHRLQSPRRFVHAERLIYITLLDNTAPELIQTDEGFQRRMHPYPSSVVHILLCFRSSPFVLPN